MWGIQESLWWKISSRNTYNIREYQFWRLEEVAEEGGDEKTMFSEEDYRPVLYKENW